MIWHDDVWADRDVEVLKGAFGKLAERPVHLIRGEPFLSVVRAKSYEPDWAIHCLMDAGQARWAVGECFHHEGL